MPFQGIFPLNSIRICYILKLLIKQITQSTHNHLLNMKLVLKYNEVIKLYMGEMRYKIIIQFLQAEMGLQKESIQITYTDQDGDQIFLGDDSDLEVLTTLTDDKSYVKINVKGQVDTEKEKDNTKFDFKSVKDTNQLECQIRDNKKQEKKQEKQKSEKSSDSIKKQKKKKAQTKPNIKAEKSQQKQQKIKKEAKKQKKEYLEINQVDEMKKFSKLMTQTITEIVDQRIQSLGSCFKKQTSDSPKKVNVKKEQIVHKGFSCKICCVNPILGVRYECPKCINFSICQECQQLCEHGHNMLKIKRIKQIDNQKDKTINKNMKKIYDLIVPEKKKKQKQLKQSKPAIDQKALKNCKQLKMIFGGQPKNYQLFVEKYPNLQFNQLLQTYCKENNIEIEEGKEKYIQMLSTRLAKLNKIEPNQLKNFVKQNLKLNYDGLVECCYKEHKVKMQVKQQKQKEEFIQKQQKPDLISKDLECSKSEPRKAEEQILIKSQSNQQNRLIENKQQKASKKQEPIDINKKMVQSVLEVNRESMKMRQNLKKSQVQIYDLMVQIFGESRCKEYPDFIRAHSKEGKDNIIMLWSSNLSIIQYKQK